MTNIEVVTTTGRDATLDETVIEEFSAGMRGDLLRSGDDGYDEARTCFNVMIDKRPALIARCAGVADVIRLSSPAAPVLPTLSMRSISLEPIVCWCPFAAAVTTSRAMPSATVG